jgi:serine O-acetyltransferase
MGDGAKAVGAITIGENSIIGVSSVATKDIPANVTAVGIPAKVIATDIIRS